RIKNAGDTHWGDGYTFGHIGGPQLADSKSVSLPPCAPGQNVDVSVEMTAPSVPGQYRSEWRPKNKDGDFFGEFVFVQIIVPQPVSTSPVPNFSQIDPRWKTKTLGTRHSDVTIGDWGCLMTCLTMVANYYGKSHTPESMVDRMLDKGLFIDAKKTPFRLLDSLYTDIIYEGRLESRANPNIAQRIDAALAAGHPVTAHVDVTPNSAYTPNDQHWVLIVGKDGSDYRIHDPLVHPAKEISLREKYSKPREALNQTIRAAIFYRNRRQMPSLFGRPGLLTAESTETIDVVEEPIMLPPLQTGMNINPDAPHSDPRDSRVLKGMNWVRFVFKIDAQPDPNMRNLRAAMRKYADLIQDYKRQGIKSLIVLNQETVWGSAPWATGASWETYAKELARVSEQIARRFKRLGDGVAYEIWNEGDAEGHASIFVPPAGFAQVLEQTAKAVKRGSPNSPIIFGGLMGGPGTGIPYVTAVQDALGGTLPIDALGIHPYGKWGTKAPFDWGNKFGTLAEEFEQYAEAFPGLKLWITEMGVANASPLGPETYRDTAMYLEDVYAHISERYVEQVPVVIWFAWSDLMRNAGIVKMDGDKKNHVFTAFERVRDRLIF
ncbi:MAG: NBR1-Ig-like domain-containing protein, partial [Chloroflexota bacterium]